MECRGEKSRRVEEDVTLRWSEKEEGIIEAVIDRPGARNAIDLATMERLEALIEELESSERVRVLTFQGAGSSFVAGGDLKEFDGLRSREEAAAMAGKMMGLLGRLEGLPIWTVAAINGDAYGGGCELSLAFDFRLLSGGARMGFTQGRFVLSPGWGGLTRLVERVGRGRALRWLATMELVEAEEALASGLVDQVVSAESFQEEVEAFGRRLARSPRSLIGALKSGAQRAMELPRNEAIEAELEPFCDLWTAEEHYRAVEGFLERRRKKKDE